MLLPAFLYFPTEFQRTSGSTVPVHQIYREHFSDKKQPLQHPRFHPCWSHLPKSKNNMHRWLLHSDIWSAPLFLRRHVSWNPVAEHFHTPESSRCHPHPHHTLSVCPPVSVSMHRFLHIPPVLSVLQANTMTAFHLVQHLSDILPDTVHLPVEFPAHPVLAPYSHDIPVHHPGASMIEYRCHLFAPEYVWLFFAFEVLLLHIVFPCRYKRPSPSGDNMTENHYPISAHGLPDPALLHKFLPHILSLQHYKKSYLFQ